MYRAGDATKPDVLCVRLEKPPAPPSEAGTHLSEETVVPEDHGPFYQEGPPPEWNIAKSATATIRPNGQRHRKQEAFVCEDEDQQGDVSTIGYDISEDEEVVARDEFGGGKDDDTDEDMTTARDDDEDGKDATELESEDEDDQWATSQANDSFLTEEYRGNIYLTANKRNKARKLNEIKAASGKYTEEYLDAKMQPRWKNGRLKGHVMRETAWHLRTIDAVADLAAVCPNRSEANKMQAAEMKQRRYRKNPTEEVQLVQIHRVCRKLRDH
ncbi:hypothetical protein CERZMDRAFT_105032 [Cercospora zeae-maydis SCOH1-5]|uniref:Uncharacterized protein n=1 Tax=Cercospora zeae-maydis SCOH1-5 TaxID=717836 RepID=A0A6A6FNS6_9PEZI|nr:hypothetical protein CERZMDRAFT_105032 [Cercospora zeae-maydis SCOH1-5]